MDYETSIDDPDFNKWCDRLDDYTKSLDICCKVSHTKDTGRECWISYYEDDLSPEQAFAEDMSYACY